MKPTLWLFWQWNKVDTNQNRVEMDSVLTPCSTDKLSDRGELKPTHRELLSCVLWNKALGINENKKRYCKFNVLFLCYVNWLSSYHSVHKQMKTALVGLLLLLSAIGLFADCLVSSIHNDDIKELHKHLPKYLMKFILLCDQERLTLKPLWGSNYMYERRQKTGQLEIHKICCFVSMEDIWLNMSTGHWNSSTSILWCKILLTVKVNTFLKENKYLN